MKAFEVFSEIFINAAIAHGFIIALFFRGVGNRVAHWMLTLLLIDLSLIVFRVHYLMYPLFDRLGANFFIIGPFLMLLAPLLFFFLRSIVEPGRGIGRGDFKHFVIFLVYMVVMLVILIVGTESSLNQLISQVVGSPWVFLVVQLGYYLTQANKLLKTHEQNMVNKLSNVEGMDASWLKVIIWIFVVIMVFVIVAVPSLIHGAGFRIYQMTSAWFYAVVLFFIGFKGVRQRVPLAAQVSTDGFGEKPTDQNLEIQQQALLDYLEQQKPFLNPELGLVDLAQQLNMSRNQLSYVINQGMGDNFYHFINGYRVEEVKKLIEADQKKQYNLLTLANDAGFNSKSSFNKVFKEITGLTPSEYRNGRN